MGFADRVRRYDAGTLNLLSETPLINPSDGQTWQLADLAVSDQDPDLAAVSVTLTGSSESDVAETSAGKILPATFRSQQRLFASLAYVQFSADGANLDVYVPGSSTGLLFVKLASDGLSSISKTSSSMIFGYSFYRIGHRLYTPFEVIDDDTHAVLGTYDFKNRFAVDTADSRIFTAFSNTLTDYSLDTFAKLATVDFQASRNINYTTIVPAGSRLAILGKGEIRFVDTATLQ